MFERVGFLQAFNSRLATGRRRDFDSNGASEYDLHYRLNGSDFIRICPLLPSILI